MNFGAVLVVIWMVSGCTASDDIPAPQISTVSPAMGRAGSVVTITGSYLCQQPDTGNEDPLSCANTGSIAFGTTQATTTVWSDSGASVEVPSITAGVVELSASVAGRTSNAIKFIIE